MRLGVVALCVLVAGCSLLVGEDDRPGAADAAPMAPDAGPTGDPFPPPGVQIRLTDAYVADVNGDSRFDVVIANTPGNSSDWGVFVLLGPINPAQPRFHAFVGSDVMPEDVSTARALPSTGADLVLGGHDVDDILYLEVYPFAGGDALFGSPIRFDRDTENIGSPVNVRFGNFDGLSADQNDAIYNTRNEMFLGTLETLGQPQADAMVPVMKSGPSSRFAVEIISGNQTDELLVMREKAADWFFNNNNLLDERISANLCGRPDDVDSPMFGRRGTAVDLTDTSIDAVHGFGETVCGVVLDIATLDVIAGMWNGGAIDAIDGEIEDAVVHDFDDNEAPDILLLDSSTTIDSQVILLADPVVSSADMNNGGARAVTHSQIPQRITPDFLAVIPDLHQVWVFDRDSGEAACLALQTTDEFAACP